MRGGCRAGTAQAGQDKTEGPGHDRRGRGGRRGQLKVGPTGEGWGVKRKPEETQLGANPSRRRYRGREEKGRFAVSFFCRSVSSLPAAAVVSVVTSERSASLVMPM